MLFGTRSEHRWVSLLLFLGIVLVILLCWKRLDFASVHEGFQQETPFVYRSGTEEVYADPMYASYYDRLMLPQDILDNVTTQVVALTQPTKSHSSILDVGSGTGTLAAALARQGYVVYGVDQSTTMIDHAKAKYEEDIPTLRFQQGNALEPMLWESGSFSHVLCTGFTYYTVQHKRRLLENCFHWLRPGGYLVLHLMDYKSFDTIVPGGRPPVPVKSSKRIVNTVIDFVDFEYKASYTFPSDDTMQLRESFTDGLTKNVRVFEQTMVVEPVRNTLELAVRCGFTGQGFAAFQHDAHQFLYVFVK